jgi:Domain of unknown function (DUF4352)
MARWRVVVGMLAVVIAAFAAIGSGSTNTAKKVNGSGSGTTTKGQPQTFKVGDTVQLGDWTVKVWSVKDPVQSTNQFLQPSAGNRWVGVDTEVANQSKDPKTVSSLACFQLEDSKHQDYNETVAAGTTPGPPDGEVAAGSSKRGLIVYEVPSDATGLSLHFKCDLFSTGSAVIGLS